MTAPRIVVGIDGSDAGNAALDWAADEARRRDATLEIVHAWSVPTGDPFMPMAIDPELVRRSGAHVLAAAVERVGTGHGLRLVPNLVAGSPDAALLAAAVDADLLVVGSHGHGVLAGVLLGSVTQRVLHHARCPVVVVRAALVPA